MVKPFAFIDEVEATPSLVVDVSIVDRNIAKLATYAHEHRINVRPHTKTHKSLLMARKQLAAGAIGLTAAKVGEAEVMAEVSDDLLVAYPMLDAHRCARLATLAKTKTIRVAMDSTEGIDAIASAARAASTTVGVLVDLDVGFHRTGAQSPAAALKLAQHVTASSSLRLDGLFFYPGHVWLPAVEQRPELARIDALLAETIDSFKKSGLAAPIVSGGSTPTAYQSHFVRHQTEIRPGTSIYNDMNTARAGFCEIDDCAARIVCTVISNAVPGKVVLDAGTKVFTSDRNATQPDSGFGCIVEYPDAMLMRLSEEHGEVDVTACERHPKLGERVTVIPNHICPCVNLQTRVWLGEADGRLHAIDVDARGKVI